MFTQYNNHMQTIPFTNHHQHVRPNIQIQILYKTCYLHAILYIWTQWTKPRALHYCYAIQQIQIQMPSHGTQMSLWLCLIHGESITWCQRHLCLSQQYWYLLVCLGTSHLTTRQKLLQLEANGFTVNLLKCKWAIQETDWLGLYPQV